MKIVQTKDLVPGMITARPILSKAHQVIVGANVPLTKVMICHLDFFNVQEAYIVSEENTSAQKPQSVQEEICQSSIVSSPSPKTDIISLQKHTRNHIECKHFKNTFLESIETLKTRINDVILKIEDPNGESLLAQMLTLFDSMQETVDIYSILHTIRKADESTYTHSINVGILCRLMGQWMNYSREDIDILTLCGLLHDIGKIKIPKAILSKPGALSKEEYALIKRHSILGYEILKKLPLDHRIKRAALMHHERCDASGYPLGLIQEDIDPFAVIVSIADVYDAMTSKRCYRDAICPFEVIATFEKEGFHKYNPTYVTTFLNHIVDSYMHNNVILNNGSSGQIVWKNKDQLARPTIYLPTREFVDLSQHPELSIQEIM
ncbi:MAG: HD-GYP domain-containing protein [Lachnospiraceae bacterium]